MGAGERVMVNERFCGPPAAGNGGYVAGLLARRLGLRAEVSLRRPTPLGTPLRLRRDTDSWLLEMENGGELLVAGRTAEPLIPRLRPPVVPDFEQAAQASVSLPGHPYPRCFVCGPERAAGDGLRIFAGRLGGARSDVVAGAWVPDASLCGKGAQVGAQYLWSALDCPGALALMAERPRPMLLARMTAERTGRVRRNERCVLVGWRIASDGRKHTCGTALFGEDGTLRAASEQLWVEPRAAA